MNKLILALTLVFLVLVQSDEKIQKALELGRDASNKLVDSVKSVLFQELGKGGYVGAIKACSNIAQDIIIPDVLIYFFLNIFTLFTSPNLVITTTPSDKYRLVSALRASSQKFIFKPWKS